MKTLPIASVLLIVLARTFVSAAQAARLRHGTHEEQNFKEDILTAFDRSGKAIHQQQQQRKLEITSSTQQDEENHGRLEQNIPLGKCEGDCFSNDDCAQGLICMKRTSNEAVPGCNGFTSDQNSGKNVCYDLADDDDVLTATTTTRAAAQTSRRTLFGKCKGDCDSDSDCEGNLVCFQRNANEKVVPGCIGEGDDLGTDYCIDEGDITTGSRTGPIGTVYRVNENPPLEPLDRCHGDCDDDSECKGDLVCYQLESDESYVPGCIGEGKFSTDYCVNASDINGRPPTPPEGIVFRVEDNPPLKPLDRCHGDCDDDSECKGNLVCYQLESDESYVPGCKGEGSFSTDYCVDPSDLSAPEPTGSPPTTPNIPNIPIIGGPDIPLTEPGDDHDPKEVFPLGLCQGECDGDSDCAGNLVCHQREGDNPVPGCVGSGKEDADYCIRPRDETAKPPTRGAFRLKLWWQAGYTWQDETWEREWCIRCEDRSCPTNGELELFACDDESTWFEFLNLNLRWTQIRIAGTNLCLQIAGSLGFGLRARECNRGENRQRFTAGDGSFRGEKFEISPLARRGFHCLGSDHHPKEGELVRRFNCERQREYQVSFWTKY